jgi:hypothetical protein
MAYGKVMYAGKNQFWGGQMENVEVPREEGEDEKVSERKRSEMVKSGTL